VSAYYATAVAEEKYLSQASLVEVWKLIRSAGAMHQIPFLRNILLVSLVLVMVMSLYDLLYTYPA
jgi:hypothetical protein